MDFLAELEYRGLINQLTEQEKLKKILDNESITLYCGFDPTADSMHIGNLLPILTLKRFQLAGHKPIALVGGGTGLIGDPSGKTSERTLNSKEVVEEWQEKFKCQLRRLLDFDSKENPAQIVNNFDWLGNLKVIEFLRDIGKNFSVGYMLGKESVRSRLERGISFTEFSYMILQSYDFYILNKEYNCILQIGGSDQWGNITAGVELIRRLSNNEAYGLTIPLVTKSDGTKFGKTESGAVWLDAEKTSPYEFYQFWLNVDDKDVIKLLKYYTFLSKEEIEELELKLKEAPEKREAHHKLAQEVTTIVHGKEAMLKAEKISEVLFSGNIKELTQDELEQGFKDVPSLVINSDESISLVDLLVRADVFPSKRQAREGIQSGGIYINGERCIDVDKIVVESDRLFNKYVVIRRGRKNYYLVKYNT